MALKKPERNWDRSSLVLVLTCAGVLLGVLVAAKRSATKDLPLQDFALCSGLTQPGHTRPALADWLAQTIDRVVGLAPGQGPLTFAHLKSRAITIQTVTTDLTTRRPYALPIGNNLYAFDQDEFRRLFPEDVVARMIRHSTKVLPEWGDQTGRLHYFRPDDLPVVVLARMSLSFPCLISAVPLHRIDHTLQPVPGKTTIRRCLFSDGGVSSNFPVHFFATVLPQVPTFGSALAPYDPDRDPVQGSERRIILPTKADATGRMLPTLGFTGVAGFVMTLFDSAKEHRWRRFLTELPAIEDMLIRFAETWDAAEPAPQDLSYPDLVAKPGRLAYDLTAGQRATMAARAEMLARLGRALKEQPLPKSLVGAMPVQRASLRLVADMDGGDAAKDPGTS